MTSSQDTIENFLATCETKRVEFKSSFGKGVIETLCTFANHKCSLVRIWLNGFGKPLGVIPGFETIQEWVNIRIRTEIASHPSMEIICEESRDGFLATLRYQHQKISSAAKSHEGIKSLLQHILKQSGQPTPQFASPLEVPVKTIERLVQELKRQKLIESRGSKQTVGYYGRGSE